MMHGQKNIKLVFPVIDVIGNLGLNQGDRRDCD